jgi:hypothetical protein
MPAWQNPGAAAATAYFGADGKVSYGPMLRVALYVLESHRLAQVLNSFNIARRQIPEAAAGLVYLNVDTSQIPAGDEPLYLRTLAEGVRRRFTPDLNRRIAAVVLTGGIARVEIIDKGFHRTGRHWAVIRNPHAPLAPSLSIPGEMPCDLS